jgi:CRP-like cAMP-binding protein
MAQTPHAKTPTDIVWAMPFFSDLSDAEKAELLKVASFRHHKRNEMIFLQGDPLTHLYWVCKGAAQMFRETPDGHELTSSFRIIGDLLFDPDAAKLKHSHTMNARALEEVTLFTLPAGWIDENLQAYDHLARKFMALLALQVYQTQIETEHQATMNAAQIVACFLQHLCVLHKFDPRGFDLPYSKSLIASRLGMQLESFSRTLPKLHELGIIVSGKHVSFTDIATAQQFSCGACSVAEECHTHQGMRALAQGNGTTATAKVTAH